MCVCVHILFHFLAPFSILVFFLTEKFTISSHKKRMHFRYMWYNHSLIETMKSLVCGGRALFIQFADLHYFCLNLKWYHFFLVQSTLFEIYYFRVICRFLFVNFERNRNSEHLICLFNSLLLLNVCVCVYDLCCGKSNQYHLNEYVEESKQKSREKH